MGPAEVDIGERHLWVPLENVGFKLGAGEWRTPKEELRSDGELETT
jgi:hypothetical protein